MTINDLQHLSRVDGGADELSQAIGGIAFSIGPGDIFEVRPVKRTFVFPKKLTVHPPTISPPIHPPISRVENFCKGHSIFSSDLDSPNLASAH
jgi:hypothetical protein